MYDESNLPEKASFPQLESSCLNAVAAV